MPKASVSPVSYIEQPRYTPCGQLLSVRVGADKELQVQVLRADGSSWDLPDIARAHIDQWYKSAVMHDELNLRIASCREFIQSSLARVSDDNARMMQDGLASYYDELHRCNMNLSTMKTIRDVAIQRALVAIDKSMVDHHAAAAHGHMAPVVALARSVRDAAKTGY